MNVDKSLPVHLQHIERASPCALAVSKNSFEEAAIQQPVHCNLQVFIKIDNFAL